jgi:hypothetical protein
MDADALLHLQHAASNANTIGRRTPERERTRNRIEAMCVYCISRTHQTQLVSIHSWLSSQIPTWPLHPDLTVVHKKSCRQRLYDLVNNDKHLPCFWDFFFQSMIVVVSVRSDCMGQPPEVGQLMLSQLSKHCAYRSHHFDCSNPTHLFHRFLLFRPRSHKDAELSTYCHSWYHCIENCRRHRHPDTPLLISDSDAAQHEEDFICELNATGCDVKLW